MVWRGKMKNLSKRILVVDDDQGILDSFEVLLGDRYNLVKAENGYGLFGLGTPAPSFRY
jgi:DNA-binding NtrC family response regulator